MKLSAEQFKELSASFGAAVTADDHERRRTARIELQARVSVTPIVGQRRGASKDVTVCDFSPRGMSFLNDAAMNHDDQFVAHIPRRGGGTVDLLCTVLHVRTITEKQHRIGVEFTCSLDPQR